MESLYNEFFLPYVNVFHEHGFIEAIKLFALHIFIFFAFIGAFYICPMTRPFVCLMFSIFSLFALIGIYAVRVTMWVLVKTVNVSMWSYRKARGVHYAHCVKKEMSNREKEEEELRQQAYKEWEERNSDNRNHEQKTYDSENEGSGNFRCNPRREEVYAGVLGLKGKVTPTEIKKAYRSMMTKYHPDRVQSLGREFKEMALEKAKEINEAYSFFKERYGV